MPSTMVMDELRVTVLAPAGLPEAQHRPMHRSLHSQRLLLRLRQAVAGVFGLYRSLQKVRITLSR